MQRNARGPLIFLEVFIQTEDDGLDGGVGEAVSGSGENIGDGRVNISVVSRIPPELPPHGFLAHDVW